MSAATVAPSRADRGTRPEPLRREDHPSPDHLEALDGLDRAHARVGEAQLGFLAGVARAEGSVRPSQEGFRSFVHLVSCRYGVPYWKAQRIVGAARALPRLPRISQALARGELSLDKVLELARFATPEDEEGLVRWAKGVAVAAVRVRADLATRPKAEVDREAHRGRRLEWWFDGEGRRFELFCALPAAEGMAVARAIDHVARRIPPLPGEEGADFNDARRADALVALARSHLARAGGVDRPTVVVHARWDTLTRARPGAELEGGTVVHPETARRLACTSRVEILFEDGDGRVLARARRRHPPPWMVRELHHRDRGCVFPGCGRRAHVVVHHLRPFGRGGPTTLENCCLLCVFHHVLVHELGWGLRRTGGRFVWIRPNGMPYEPGPSPPLTTPARRRSARRPGAALRPLHCARGPRGRARRRRGRGGSGHGGRHPQGDARPPAPPPVHLRPGDRRAWAPLRPPADR
ncbi:MAG TPA: DUF222 domain-containing protein [Actinomycetota bacterium]|nr:DUF222 domain-containing protein [Actinomycetota bacterium]